MIFTMFTYITKVFLTNHLNKIYIIDKKYLKNVLKMFWECLLKNKFYLIIQYYQ